MPDRAFYKKTSKARSKSELEGRARPCLLQKNVKGTVETMRQTAQPTVPFTKKRQRHGQNREADGTTDRAFYKKSSKARSKPELESRPRPCLLQKNVKGTVKTAGQRSHPPPNVAPDHALCKKHAQPRSPPKKDSATTPPWSPPPQMNSVIAPHPALIANRSFHTDTERFAWILHNLNKKTLLVLT